MNAEELLNMARSLLMDSPTREGQVEPNRVENMQAWGAYFDDKNKDRDAIYNRINKLPDQERLDFLRFMEQWEIQDTQRKRRMQVEEYQKNLNNRLVPPEEQWRWTPPGQQQKPLKGVLT